MDHPRKAARPADIGGAGLIQAGTDIPAKRLIEARVRVYLVQLRCNQGPKGAEEPIDDAELAAHLIAPCFCQVTEGTCQVTEGTAGRSHPDQGRGFQRWSWPMHASA